MGEAGARGATSTPPARRRRSGRRVAAFAMIASLVVAGVSAGAEAQSETPAERAAREIQEARDRANAAADAFFEAESTLFQLQDDLDELEADEAALQTTVDQLRAEVEVVALARYIQSGTEGIPLLTDVSAPQDQVQAEVFADILTNTGADVLDEYDAAQSDLEDTQSEVADQQAEIEAQREVFAQLEEDALDEVERLREVEAQRLEDEAVQAALEAQLAAERAAAEEQARIDAEAAARAQPNPGLQAPSTTEAPPSTPAPDPDAPVPTAPDGSPATTTSTTTTTTTTEPVNSGGSGGTSGGRTGDSGGGSGPAPVNNGGVYVDSIICPMPGSAYGDTWGAARSGGRRHEGVDMIAPIGLPIYAVVGGQATFKQNRLGGNAVSLVGDNGNRYYYAHLDRYEGGSRRVSQGELIGYNGDTGNARFSTPHLHFQVHPGGGRAVNPYPTVRAAGC